MEKEIRKNRNLSGPVRVVIPAEVSYDPDRLLKVMLNLGEKLGCLPCLSGVECTFSLEKDFVVNPADLTVHAEVGPWGYQR